MAKSLHLLGLIRLFDCAAVSCFAVFVDSCCVLLCLLIRVVFCCDLLIIVVFCCALLIRVVFCCALLSRVVLCCTMRCVVLCCTMRCVVLCCVVLSRLMQSCVVFCAG